MAGSDDMGFRKQLVGGLAVQIALILIVCAVSAFTLHRVTREARRDTLQTLEDVRGIHQVHTQIEELVASARGFLITGDSSLLDRVDVLGRELDAGLDALAHDTETTAELAELSRRLHEYSAAITVAVRERERVKDLAALELLYDRRLAPLRDLLEQAFDHLEGAKSQRLAVRMAAHEGLSFTTVLAVSIAALIAIALSVAVGVIVIRRTSSQYRQIQRANDAANEAAAHRKELLDIVSHDLRAPLNTIVLGIDALRDEQLPQLRILEHAARSMERLVNDLLDTARAETKGLPLELAANDSQQLLELAVELFAARAERAGVELRIDHPSHVSVVADRDRVLQILANLIANALKVTPRGGVIVLAADPTPDGIRFSVRDSGPGLDTDNIPDLFEAYRQGNTAWRRGSLGLGLYISKTLTHAHGGKIGVDTHRHDGSTFWFELPRDPGARAS
jgi:signal transduction histidine kinase